MAFEIYYKVDTLKLINLTFLQGVHEYKKSTFEHYYCLLFILPINLISFFLWCL